MTCTMNDTNYTFFKMLLMDVGFFGVVVDKMLVVDKIVYFQNMYALQNILSGSKMQLYVNYTFLKLWFVGLCFESVVHQDTFVLLYYTQNYKYLYGMQVGSVEGCSYSL
eukprot:TRINITY_DN2990_c0_g2_i10.p9 TRINITY_DN2990_c0_g2~~TRINITY_DN2990_c0_g2_i10.p9  ORF type:complete len:109 (-),score=9.04 TRINITY_DN2990_c0_g2_i10:591-917(-)